MTSPEKLRQIEFAPGRLDIGAAIDWVGGIAQQMGASERQRFAVKLCAEELLANLLRHDKTSPAVSLILETDGSRITLSIEDGGAPYDPTQTPERETLGGLDEARPGGWGVALVRRFADEFTYHRRETGNLVLLAFFRERHAPR